MNESKRAPSGRVSRQPVGLRNRLAGVTKEPGYVYRYVNDEDDRVAICEAAGYEFVDNSAINLNSHRRLNEPAVEGAKALVSVGGGKKAFLMRIREDWYKEDQNAKLKQVRETQEAMKYKDKNEYGLSGSISIGDKTE